jgi:hypothetical protein
MEPITPKPETIIALQNFLAIWRQDPVSQNTLCITPQNTLIWNPQKEEEIVDITDAIQKPPEFDINEFLDIEEFEPSFEIQEETETINDSIEAEETTEESEVITKIINDLKQVVISRTTSFINPYIRGTWEDQVKKILRDLPKKGKARDDQIKAMEAYLYLGIIINEQIIYKIKIKEMIQKSRGTRKAKDIWKGAQRFQKIFEIRPKDLLYQSTCLTITNVVKLTDLEFDNLLVKIQT